MRTNEPARRRGPDSSLAKILLRYRKVEDAEQDLFSRSIEYINIIR